MANLTEVRHLLRNISGAVVSRKKDGLFPVSVRDIPLSISESLVDQYLSMRDRIKRPHETAMSVPGYYEQAIEFQGRAHLTSFMMREVELKMENKEKTRTISVDHISDLFSLVLLDSETVSRELLRFISMSRSMHRNRVHYRATSERGIEVPGSVASLLERVRTVRVSTNLDDTIASNDKRLHALCEAALFHVAYGHGVGISLSTSWERAYYRFGLRQAESVQFPLRTYKSELLAYYHLAFGSDSLILAYLALYKILEYFFTSASENLLHNKMAQKLVEPDFAHTKAAKLRELAKTIRTHDSRMDERRMLATVLSDYFDPKELRQWVDKHDSENDNHFTTERQIFAEAVRIDTSNDQIFTTTAQRIYHIRNALVHHKEGEESRFIPFSGQEEVLFREIPLLLFIAEQLIIKTGKDI